MQDELFGNIVFSYTRAQALQDGTLIEVTNAARTHGFRLPFALSYAVFARFVAGDADGESGRLYRLLRRSYEQARAAARSAGGGGDRIYFDFTDDRGSEHLILHVGPGDTAAPVLTLMTQADD